MVDSSCGLFRIDRIPELPAKHVMEVPGVTTAKAAAPGRKLRLCPQTAPRAKAPCHPCHPCRPRRGIPGADSTIQLARSTRSAAAWHFFHGHLLHCLDLPYLRSFPGSLRAAYTRRNRQILQHVAQCLTRLPKRAQTTTIGPSGRLSSHNRRDGQPANGLTRSRKPELTQHNNILCPKHIQLMPGIRYNMAS